jgi:hypothetical protein
MVYRYGLAFEISILKGESFSKNEEERGFLF